MQKQKRGFTLVELIVVITILAILGTIAIMAFGGYSKNARDSARISDIANMKKSLELWILQSGTYPEPTNGTGVTFSGSILWTQGTFGESVFNTVGKLEKKPIDPLFESEYTYSVTNSKKEYELGAVVESDSFTSNMFISQTYAASEGKAYISGTYNGVLITIKNGDTSIVALPSIILSDLSKLELKNETNVSFVYNGKKNLPSSFNDIGLTMTGSDFSFTPEVVWTGTGIEVLNNQINFQEFVTNLQTVYKNNVVFSSLPQYTNIVGVENTTTPAMSFLKTLVETTVNTELTKVKVEPEAIQGICGSENGKSLSDSSSITGIGGCTSGKMSSISGSGPWNWTCSGSYGGVNANCSANPNLIFTGNGTSASPWKLNGGSIISCQDYNLNATINTSNSPRSIGTCGNGTKECFSNGIYVIDPDGSGGNAEFPVYCEMNIDKGGWTLLNRWTMMSDNSYTYEDICGSTLNFKTYSNDSTNYPVFVSNNSNFGTECLYIGGNVTWNTKFGWIKYNKGAHMNSLYNVGFQGYSEKLGNYTFGTQGNGWGTNHPTTYPFTIWESPVNGGMCGGAGICGNAACPSMQGSWYGCHFDLNSQKYIYVR